MDEAPDDEIDPNDPRWARVDVLLLAGSRLEAVAAAREEFGLTLQDAIFPTGDRFEHLRRSRLVEFSVPVVGYWDGFYT